MIGAAARAGQLHRLETIVNAPQLAEGLEMFYDAFHELSSCRQLGFAVGPIPWTAMKLYCDEHKLDEEQRLKLYCLVGKMDAEYLKRVNKKK